MPRQGHRLSPIVTILTVLALTLTVSAGCGPADDGVPPASDDDPVTETGRPSAGDAEGASDAGTAEEDSGVGRSSAADSDAPFSQAKLGALSYTVEDRTVMLEDGVYTEKPSPDSATYIMRLELRDRTAHGDLDGDGDDDMVAVLVNAPGGSGTFVYLAVLVNEDGTPVNADTMLLGDRVQIEALEIADGTVQLDVMTHGPDDPMCCPSQAATWSYTLEDGVLTPQ